MQEQLPLKAHRRKPLTLRAKSVTSDREQTLANVRSSDNEEKVGLLLKTLRRIAPLPLQNVGSGRRVRDGCYCNSSFAVFLSTDCASPPTLHELAVAFAERGARELQASEDRK